jgi:hypothetical protein
MKFLTIISVVFNEIFNYYIFNCISLLMVSMLNESGEFGEILEIAVIATPAQLKILSHFAIRKRITFFFFFHFKNCLYMTNTFFIRRFCNDNSKFSWNYCIIIHTMTGTKKNSPFFRSMLFIFWFFIFVYQYYTSNQITIIYYLPSWEQIKNLNKTTSKK